MKIQAEEIILEDVEKIVPNPKNMNEHSEDQIERLCKLIEFQGFRNPCVVSKRSGFLVVGHGRLMAAKKLGMEKVPVIYQDFKDEAQEYAYLVSDNAIAEWASLDLSQINTDILDFGPELDIEMLGLKNFTIEPLDADLPDLAIGDNDLQKMTFTLSNDQADIINAAIEKAKSMGPLIDELNSNENGCAIARVAEIFTNGR